MSDLHIGADEATVSEAAAVDAIVTATLGPTLVVEGERLVRGGQKRARERRNLLLPCLHALQKEAGWISPGGLNYVCEALQVPPAEAYGVATFYDLFSMDPPTSDTSRTHVCIDAACQLAGSEALLAEMAAGGENVHASPCLGQCERPPALYVQGRASDDWVPADVEPYELRQVHHAGLSLMKRAGRIDPESLESYIGAGGYKALAKAFTLGPQGVIDEITTAGLMGRGGAAFPTGIKWAGVAGESGQKHIVVNADESEPGTFKDRVLMENDPFSIIEAATIAGFATGATKGWIYIRGEYPLATSRLENAIVAAREAGFLGQGIARSSVEFDIEVRRGAGAYICGEETALFNSLEGYRGEPRQKPPFPTTNGLFNQPTAINNPETLANVLGILLDTGAAYAASGTDGSNGTKLFCLSGHVERPGVYEVPFGVTLAELIELAGGPIGSVRSILLGGAAGSFVGPELMDMPLSAEDARANGASLGSGVVMVFNETTEFGPIVERIAAFFKDESCGQCVPCRVGTIRQHELLVRSSGGVSVGDLQLLDDMDVAMKDASICGLGHTAATAVRSAIALGLIPSEGGAQ